LHSQESEDIGYLLIPTVPMVPRITMIKDAVLVHGKLIILPTAAVLWMVLRN